MKRISIVIPAYNEGGRITRTLDTYSSYFKDMRNKGILDVELLVVLNGCRDNTREIVEAARQRNGDHIRIMDLKQAGKGLAVAEGFKDALTRPNDYIGFVDADMATKPEHFYDLFVAQGTADGAIASRYMAGAQIYPPRPFVKSWGRKLVYHSLIRALFGMKYYDYQCGAKLFTRQVVAAIAPHLHERRWAFDVELLYLCKKNGCVIKEVPTVWHDQDDSKLKVMRSGMRMLGSLFELRWRHMRMRTNSNKQNKEKMV